MALIYIIMAHEDIHFVDLAKSNITEPDPQDPISQSNVKPRVKTRPESQVTKEQIRAFIEE